MTAFAIPSDAATFYDLLGVPADERDPGRLEIVPVYHVGEHGDVPYLAMPLLRGETLEARLLRDGKLPPTEAARVAGEVALGLSAAHARGLIHRDVKPANVWLEEKTGRVKLLDFGLARVTDEPGLSSPSVLVGTPAYIAPERAAGQKADARSDLFGLGCVLYQMLTGKHPFRGPHTLAVLRAVAMDHPPAPHALDATISFGLSHLTMRLLAKEPAGRPSSAAAAAAELASPAAGPKVEATPAPTKSDGRKPRRAWRVAAAAFAGAALLGIVVILIVNRNSGKGGDPNAKEMAPLPAGAKGKVGEPILRFASVVSRPELTPGMKGVRGWDLVTADHRGPVWNVAYSPDGKHLAYLTADAIIRVREVATGKLVRVLQGARVFERQNSVALLSWSPDGKTIAATDALGGGVRLWDAGTGGLLHLLPGTTSHPATALAFTPKGDRLAVASGLGTRIFDLKALKQVELVAAVGTDLAFSPDGRRLATNDGKLIDLRSAGEPLAIGPGEAVAFSPDGDTLAVLGGNWQAYTVRLFDAKSGKERKKSDPVRTEQSHVAGRLEWRAGGKELTAGGIVWDAVTGKVLRKHLPPALRYNYWGLAPDGRTYACGPNDTALQWAVQVRDAKTNEVKHAFRAQAQYAPPQPGGGHVERPVPRRQDAGGRPGGRGGRLPAQGRDRGARQDAPVRAGAGLGAGRQEHPAAW